MSKAKSSPKKSAEEKNLMIKIAGQVGHLAGELAAGKDHLMEMAGDAIASVKSSIHNFTTKKNAIPAIPKAKAKTAVKTAPPAKKTAAASAAKKTSPPKKSAPTKSIPKKSTPKATKKVAARK